MSENSPLNNATIFFEGNVPSTKTVCVTSANGEDIFITKPNSLPKGAHIILVCYNKKVLVNAQSAPNKGRTIYFVVNKEFDSAKVMVWESMGSMVPICDFETVK